jgi:hypothetical protein
MFILVKRLNKNIFLFFAGVNYKFFGCNLARAANLTLLLFPFVLPLPWYVGYDP